MNSVGAATPIDLSGVYKVEGFDTWDNFVIEAAEGVLHRYALSATEGLEQERHRQAALRHAVSTDDGVNWQDLDVVLEASQDGSWPDLVIWGSNGVYRDVPGGGKEFLLFVTGRSKADGELQRIGLAKSDDGHKFSRPKVVLDPTPRMGYDITDDDGILMAWRDPFVFRDHEDDRWHMLFAAKAAMPAGPPIATVGHAIAQDDDLEQWELQPPLQLPRHYRQLEVPSLVQRPGRYYLFVSTQNRPAGDRQCGQAGGVSGVRGTFAAGPLGVHLWRDGPHLRPQDLRPARLQARTGLGEVRRGGLLLRGHHAPHHRHAPHRYRVGDGRAPGVGEARL